MVEIPNKPNKSTLEFEQSCNNQRFLRVRRKHLSIVHELEQPEPAITHEELITEHQAWWLETGRHEKYSGTEKSIYPSSTTLRINKMGKDGTLTIEIPAHYAPDDQYVFDKRWVMDRNGRLIEVIVDCTRSCCSHIYQFEYDDEGYLVRSLDMHYSGYGSETTIKRENRKVTKITTQHFIGKGFLTRGNDDGEPVVTNFSTVAN